MAIFSKSNTSLITELQAEAADSNLNIKDLLRKSLNCRKKAKLIGIRAMDQFRAKWVHREKASS